MKKLHSVVYSPAEKNEEILAIRALIQWALDCAEKQPHRIVSVAREKFRGRLMEDHILSLELEDDS